MTGRNTVEQQARDLLDRTGVVDAQSYSSGDLAELANTLDEIESLRQQLADSQKREVMLRAFTEEWLSRQGTDENYMVGRAKEALAATADLDKFVLCEKEPVATMEDALDAFVDGVPLYRAKEQGK